MNSDEWILEWDKNTSKELNVIIPVRNRSKILKKFITIFKNIKKPKNKKINLTVVEQNSKSVNKKICEENLIDYIFINDSEIFNKCLCHNVGVFFGTKSKNILFHDVDILIGENFFIDLYKNLKYKQTSTLQTFNKTLIDLPKKYTYLILNDIKKLSEIDTNLLNIKNGPGGSILIDRGTFFKVGGYDAELFKGWGYEDNFFWSKVDLISKMENADSPNITLFHLYHKKCWGGVIGNGNINSIIYDTWKKYFSNEDKLNSLYILNKKIKKYE